MTTTQAARTFTVLYSFIDRGSYAGYNRFGEHTAQTETEARGIAADISRKHGHATIHHGRECVASYVDGVGGEPFIRGGAA